MTQPQPQQRDESTAPTSVAGKYGGIEVRCYDGSLDEVVMDGFHLEQMSDGCWWMSVTDKDGHCVHIILWATGKVIERNDGEPESEVVARAEYQGVDESRMAGNASKRKRDLAAGLLADAQQQLRYLWETTRSCPCGARAESLDTHPHVIGCPTGRAVELLAKAHAAGGERE